MWHSVEDAGVGEGRDVGLVVLLPWLLPHHVSVPEKKFVITDAGDGVPEVPFPFALSWFRGPLPGMLVFLTSSFVFPGL